MLLSDLSRQSSGFIFPFSLELDASSTAVKDLRLLFRTFLKGCPFGHHSGVRLLSLQKSIVLEKILNHGEHKIGVGISRNS